MRISINKVLLAFSVFLTFSCSNEVKKGDGSDTVIYECNVENIDADKGKILESDGKDLYFNDVTTRSNAYSYSGNFSSKQFPGSPYGLTTNIPKIKPDDYLSVTGWRRSKDDNGVLVIDGGGEELYRAGNNVIEEKDGWQKIFVEFHAPPNFHSGKLKVYAWNFGQDTVYFDDIQIVHKRSKSYPAYDKLSGLKIHVDKTNIQKFEQKRLEAFKTGFLMNSEEDYSKAVIYDGNDFLNGEIRLKGDLVDHLQGQKWSFRIKLKDSFTWNRMYTFSIQNPSTRHFLYEWIAHKTFRDEDVLTTRYGLTPVELNQNSLGIYAWEEHFEKQLVESMNRREGPIVRFDERIFWQLLLENKTSSQHWDIDYFGASKVIPFKENKTLKDTSLYNQFNEAQTLLNQYKYRRAELSDIFDVDKLARYYALTDIFQAFHGFTWHNQRFYFNPVTCLLEPIAFDGYIENGVYKRIEENVNGLIELERIERLSRMELMQYQVFGDSVFNLSYINYLKKYSSFDYIEKMASAYEDEIVSLTHLIKAEFPYYQFSFDYIFNQAEYISKNINEIEDNIRKVGDVVNAIVEDKFMKEYPKEINENLVPYQVHAYFDKEKNQLEVLNYSNVEIKILGVFIKGGLPETFDNKPELKAYNGVDAPKTIIGVEGDPIKLLFSANEKLIETEISRWPSPKNKTFRQQTLQKSNLDNLTVNGNSIIFDGNYSFDEDVVIPSSMEVIIEPGTKMDFVNQSGFFSFSPVFAKGTLDNPIEIISSDKSANGFNVIQVEEQSSLNFTYFSGFGNLRKGGWQTPSAVTFYEADVNLSDCKFMRNSNCDDALNIVRSEYFVANCVFDNTFADAFDSDFCTGTVHNCTFNFVGNDAIDFSGSKVIITDCKMNEIGDKAISGGENSKLMITNCEIDNANIGIAAKDLSSLKLDKIVMNKTVYGIVAFVKKPEFGPANITITNLKNKNNIVFHQIEKGSQLILNGKVIEGREKNIAVKLYQ